MNHHDWSAIKVALLGLFLFSRIMRNRRRRMNKRADEKSVALAARSKGTEGE